MFWWYPNILIKYFKIFLGLSKFLYTKVIEMFMLQLFVNDTVFVKSSTIFNSLPLAF